MAGISILLTGFWIFFICISFLVGLILLIVSIVLFITKKDSKGKKTGAIITLVLGLVCMSFLIITIISIDAIYTIDGITQIIK